MRLWAEVYAPSGERLGLVNLTRASVTRSLDAAGSLKIGVVGVDDAAHGLLQVRRRIVVYWQSPVRGKMQIGEGILLQKRQGVDANGVRVDWDATDALEELRELNTWRGVNYTDESIRDVIDDLISRAPGWTANTDLTGVTYTTTTRRFDGSSLLSAIRAVAGGAGMHIRLNGERELEAGRFGADSGVLVTNIPNESGGLMMSRQLILLEALTLTADGYDVVNVVEPLWGRGIGVLTLKRSTRDTPYIIQTRMQADGRTAYYIEDSASVAQYGRVERVLTMQDAPYIEGGSLLNAANTLYDWAVAQMDALRDVQRVYTARGVKLDKRLLPGDRLWMRWRGELLTVDGIGTGYDDINEDLFVLKVTENYGTEGLTVDLDLSNISSPQAGVADLIGDLLTDDTNIGQSLVGQLIKVSDEQTVDTATPIDLVFEIGELAVDVGTIRVSVRRDDGSGPYAFDVVVDGVFVPGGPFLVDDSGVNVFEVDVDEIVANSLSLVGEHDIRVQALYGSGNVRVNIEGVIITIS